MREIFSKVEISNERSQREWNWLRANFSPQRIEDAFLALGGSKAFPLNLARRMGINLPLENELPEIPAPPMSAEQRAVLKEKFIELRAQLKQKTDSSKKCSSE